MGTLFMAHWKDLPCKDLLRGKIWLKFENHRYISKYAHQNAQQKVKSKVGREQSGVKKWQGKRSTLLSLTWLKSAPLTSGVSLTKASLRGCEMHFHVIVHFTRKTKYQHTEST